MDVLNWSGSGYNIANALRAQNIELDFVGNLRYGLSPSLELKKHIYKLINKRFQPERSMYVASNYASQVQASLKSNSDILFSPGTLPLALLKTNKPKVFYTDATFAGMLNYYDDFKNLCTETIVQGNLLEQEALSTSRLAIFASDWAAKSATDHYLVDPGKIKVVPFGANIEHNYSLSEINLAITKRSKAECHLLFIGVDWERKGGALAINVAERLNQLGLKTTLHVAGIQNIPVRKLPTFVKNYGFISKATCEGRTFLNQLLLKSHFLIVPSRAEAYGLVYCEANSFGVPAIATAVGGIPTVIKDEVNGKLFPLEASDNAYAEYILQVFTDNRRYQELALSSFNEYTQRLNWSSAGQTIKNLLKEVL
ncbi:glycosyltransferase family 4 protein [Pontibacter burrus]|nr:glycosyltransferase family 4 protein [Pontibacter burrus]